MGRSPSMPNMKILDTGLGPAKASRAIQPVPPVAPIRHSAMPAPVPARYSELPLTGAPHLAASVLHGCATSHEERRWKGPSVSGWIRMHRTALKLMLQMRQGCLQLRGSLGIASPLAVSC